MKIKRLSSSDADFDAALTVLLAFESAQDDSVEQAVAAILADVKARGDAAVLEYTGRFDRLDVRSHRRLREEQPLRRTGQMPEPGDHDE